ncbi:hypothetical protein DFH08DRAFT_1090110 [Mycena albidolilacea]|uniref:Uncharacterized protein n=1 Tax=Mycena albidolilacea TaxID=1033008 RepID=A0AAD6YYW5_9AGAR|nr:hypothetical protein DFH08DRAFT_1090110 [Mycena albidolilacea]
MFVRVLSPFRDRGAGNAVEAPMDSLAPKAKVKRSGSANAHLDIVQISFKTGDVVRANSSGGRGSARLSRLPPPTGELLPQRKKFVIQSLTLVLSAVSAVKVGAWCSSAVDHGGFVPRSALVGGMTSNNLPSSPSLWTDTNTLRRRQVWLRRCVAFLPLLPLFYPFPHPNETRRSFPLLRSLLGFLPLSSPSSANAKVVSHTTGFGFPSSSSLLRVLFLFIGLSLANSQDDYTTGCLQKFCAYRILLAGRHRYRGDFGAVYRVQVLVSSRLVSIRSPPLRARDGLRFTSSELRSRFAA